MTIKSPIATGCPRCGMELVRMSAAWLLGASPVPLIILGTAFLTIGIAVLAGWAVHCREKIPARTLLLVPLYAAWKIPLYAAFLWRRQQQWVRTARDSAPS